MHAACGHRTGRYGGLSTTRPDWKPGRPLVHVRLRLEGEPQRYVPGDGHRALVGCLNGTTCGRFTTTYTFTGKFTENEAEIHGRCQHAVTGTSGGFAGRSGVIQFKDDVDSGIFYYRGNINS